MRAFAPFAFVFAGFVCVGVALAGDGIRFARAAPVQAIGDTLAIAEPRQRRASTNEWLIDEHWRRPLDDFLALRATVHAGDVNSIEEVVASSWYTPADAPGRLSRTLNAGPAFAIHPGPLAVVGARRGHGDPYLLVRDGRGETYRLEFDDPREPEMRTAAVAIANRLLGEAGYNALDCIVTEIAPTDLVLDSHPRDFDPRGGSGTLTSREFRDFMARLAPGDPVRVAASRVPRGVMKGSFSDRGTRDDDPNDTIAHENRRALRGLWPLMCWLDLPGLNPDRCLDVFLQPQNYLRHYLVGFAGGLSFLREGPGARFDPYAWGPGYPFLPFERATFGDLFWGLETLLACDAADIRAAVGVARFSTNERAQSVAEALVARRAEVARAILARINGITGFRVLDQGRGRWQLAFEDLGVRSGMRIAEQTRFEMTLAWPELGGAKSVQSRSASGTFDLAPYVPPAGAPAQGPRRYAIATFRAFSPDGHELRGVTRVHFRWDSDRGPEIAGIERI